MKCRSITPSLARLHNGAHHLQLFEYKALSHMFMTCTVLQSATYIHSLKSECSAPLEAAHMGSGFSVDELQQNLAIMALAKVAWPGEMLEVVWLWPASIHL